jgi:hypothetical protein
MQKVHKTVEEIRKRVGKKNEENAENTDLKVINMKNRTQQIFFKIDDTVSILICRQ